MALQEEDVAHHAEIEDACCLVFCAGGEEVAFQWFEEGFGDHVFMPVERREAASCARVPELDLMVFAAGDEQAFGGVPVDGFGVPAVAGQGGFFAAAGEVPDFQRCVVRGGHEFGVGGGEGKVADGCFVRLDGFDVVEVGLPVFD